MKKLFLHSLPFRLLVGVAFGICIGLLLNIIDESAITTAVLNVVVTSKYILGQLISFSVPLIIIDLSHHLLPDSETMLPEC